MLSLLLVHARIGLDSNLRLECCDVNEKNCVDSCMGGGAAVFRVSHYLFKKLVRTLMKFSGGGMKSWLTFGNYPSIKIRTFQIHISQRSDRWADGATK